MDNTVVISGIGILSPLGIGLEDHITALKEGKSSLRASAEGSFANNIGSVPDFSPGKYIENKKALKFFSRQTIFGCTAAELAKQDTGLSVDEIKKKSLSTALIVGSGFTHSLSLKPVSEAIIPCVDENGNLDYSKLGDTGYRNLPPLWILGRLPNTTSGQISIQNGIKGLNYSVVNGINSGIVAIGESFLVLRQQRAVRAFCGAVEDAISPDVFCRMLDEGVISPSIHDSYPFSGKSKGFIGSEGAAILILETEKEAEERGAKPYAEIIGYSNLYIPDRADFGCPEDLVPHFEKCMIKALESADIAADDVDFIQASAGGNSIMDAAEAAAIRKLFGKNPWVTAVQSYIGNTLAASGAISVAISCLELQGGFIAPIISDKSHLLDKSLNYVTGQAVEVDSKICLINSFSYLGEISSLVVRKRDRYE